MLQNDSYILKIINRVENNSWFLFFWTIQQQLLLLQKSRIILDLSQCTYCSPEPFLSLCMTLYSCKEDNNNKVKVILPQEGTPTNNRFLKYCNREGFYGLLSCLDRAIAPLENATVNTQGSSTSLNYHPIIPARVINIDDRTALDVTQELIESIVSYGVTLNQHEKNDLRITLRNILFELIDNVKVHAYDGCRKKWFGVYVRARFETEITRNQGIKENNIENKTFFPSDVFNEDAIEINFMDLGKGLVQSWRDKGLLEKYSNRPLREIFQMQFFQQSSRTKTDVTAHSGLDVIKALLIKNNNPIKIVTGMESVGGFLKMPAISMRTVYR